MSRRPVGALCALLLLSTLIVSWYAWRLRAQLAHAELYVQSGADSVFFVCSPVLRELEDRHTGGPDPGMLRIARQCLGQVPDTDAQSVADDFARKDITAITARIKAKLDDRELPFMTASAVEARYLPRSYKN